jgi:alkylated DNA repair dioxygenase AlkB
VLHHAPLTLRDTPTSDNGPFFIGHLTARNLLQMDSLFPSSSFLPEGFSYFKDFLTSEEEKQLLSEIQHIELHTFLFQGYETKRKVASFGYDYNFDKRTLTKGKEIPNDFKWLTKKTAEHIKINVSKFAELLITEYPPGAVINWHRDAPPFQLIAGISLLSDCIFRLRPLDKSKRGRKSILSFPVRRRSLYVMKDIVRSDWEHSTSPVKETRYSITLRTLTRQ